MTAKNTKKLTILHSNDLHGDFLAEHIDEKLIGGVSLLSGYINDVRKKEKNVVYAIAGDMFRGSIIDSEYQGLSTIEIMNMLSPDIVTIGNHETDYGIGQLLFLEKCAKFPIVNANLHIRTNNARLFKPCRILKIDGMKVLFIGILTEEVISQTKNDGMIGSLIDVEDAAKAIAKICNMYNSIDIDFTVLLTHIGFEEDKKLASLLDKSLGVDIIIGGHSHTLLEEPCIVNDILIVQAGTGTNQIGRFDIVVDTDEGPRAGTTAESLGKLRCCSGKPDGVITAGNASGINDGAAAVVVMSEEKAKELGVTPMATFVAGALGGVAPEIMGVGPVASTKKVMEKTGLTVDDMDLIEANEAFAAQSVAVARDLKFDMSKVNVNGGAIALGHPVGASGCRILVTLLHEMQKRDAKKGLATLCIGGGMGCSTIVERD